MVFRLIYRSRSVLDDGERDAALADIFSVARSSNKDKDVTGALLLYDDKFAQALEGEQETVQALFARIEKDPRHESVEVLESGPVGDRAFSRWAMAQVAEHGHPDIRLLASGGSVVAAADQPTTPAQEQVLDVMRNATRGFGAGY